MKKYMFLPFAALALGFAACDEESSLGIPVVNPEIPAVDPSIVTVAQSPETPAVISLEAYNDNATDFPIATISPGEGWPEGYDFGAVAQVSTDEYFSNPYDMEALVVDNTIYLNPEAMQGYIYDTITKDPSELTLWVRFGVEAVKDKEVIRLGGADSYLGVRSIQVKPFEPAAVIEPAYYLIYSVDAETWTKDHAVKFTKGSQSQYDNPNFTFVHVFDTPAGVDGVYWKILPESTYTTFDLENGLVIGVADGDTESRNGKLDESADALAGYIDITGRVYFEVNLDRVTAAIGDDNAKNGVMTFSYKQALENFWLAGDNVNGMTWSFSDMPTMWTNNYIDYVGFAVLGSEFKFSPTNGWSGDFGSDGGLEFSTNKSNEYVGHGMATGGKNINVGKPGLYYISLNYATKELNLTLIESIGIIGGFNGWAESVNMTPSADGLTFTATQALNKGDDWKFRANNAWSVSLGGSLDNLDPFNGPNIVCEESGTYEITLHLGEIPWSATMVKK